MSGFVAVVSREPAGGSLTRSVLQETEALAVAYVELRGDTGAPSPTGEAGRSRVAAVGFGTEVTEGPHGWSLWQGSVHGERRSPTTRADLDDVDGQFSVLSAAPGQDGGRVLLATDRFAAAPVYVAERGDLVYVSTSAMVLARHLRPRADLVGLRNFLVSGYQFGPETHWEGVRRLEPGVVLEVEDGGVREQEYWRAAVDPAVEALDLGAAAEHLIEVSVATMRERLGGQRTWLDLTGGYDSRLMALLAAEAKVPFDANTRGSFRFPDAEMARALAGLRQWPWQLFEVPDDWPQRLPDEVHTSLAGADGRLEVLQLSRVSWAHEQMAATLPRLLSAGGGEHLQYYAWNTEILQPRRSSANLGRWVDMLALKPTELDVLADGSRAATRADHVERFTARAELYADQPTSRQLDACYAYKTGGHFGAYRAADDVHLAAQLPFFFEPIFSAAFSVHRRHRSGFRLMREMMHRLDPEAAALPTTRGGPALPMRPTTVHRYAPYYQLLARKAVNKVWGLATGQALFPFPQSFPWSERDASAAVADRLRADGLLDWDRMRIAPLLSDAGLDRLRRTEVGAGMLGRVVTAEAALSVTGTRP